MQKIVLSLLVAILVTLAFSASAVAQQVASTQPAASQPTTQEELQAKMEKRADQLLKSLDLKDPKKEADVRQIMVPAFMARGTWAGDADRKSLQKELKTLKDANADAEKIRGVEYQLALRKIELNRMRVDLQYGLEGVLTREQVDAVKDFMSYNKYNLLRDSYFSKHPDLTEEQKGKVLEILAVGRDEAMMGGTSDEKKTIWNRFVGKVDYYISSLNLASDAKAKARARAQAGKEGKFAATSTSPASAPAKD